jgi:Holliday junction resolvase RusA-like endonuclease
LPRLQPAQLTEPEKGMKTITLTLPWPPSINSMYQQGIIGGKRNLEDPFEEVLVDLVKTHKPADVDELLKLVSRGGKDLRARVKQAFGSPRASMFLSDVGKAYRETAAAALDEQKVPRNALHGRLDVDVIAYMPDARLRDLSNLWKSALDVLQHNQVIANDGHFDHECIERGPIRRGGAFVVTLKERAAAFESRQQGFDLQAAS